MGESNRGRFVWYDLMTGDPDGAKAFYPEVTGWGMEAWEDAPEGMPPYTMWTADDAPIGGVSHLPEEARAQGARPHWLGYIETDDVDAVVERATELGAEVLTGPDDIPTVGRIVVLRDPQGAVISFFTPETPMELHEGEPRPGDFTWHELGTTDLETAWDFYSGLFGWEVKIEHDMGVGGIYREFRSGDVPLGGMYARTPDMPGSPGWMYYAFVADLDAAVETAATEGGRVLVAPREVPGGDRIAVCADPSGAVFALHARDSG